MQMPEGSRELLLGDLADPICTLTETRGLEFEHPGAATRDIPGQRIVPVRMSGDRLGSALKVAPLVQHESLMSVTSRVDWGEFESEWMPFGSIHSVHANGRVRLCFLFGRVQGDYEASPVRNHRTGLRTAMDISHSARRCPCPPAPRQLSDSDAAAQALLLCHKVPRFSVNRTRQN
jgi:hypothetical protein